VTGIFDRGPSGAALFPPTDLAVQALPLETIPAGTVLYRVHRSANGPIFFGPGAGKVPVYRFDSAKNLFGILYISREPNGAIVETLCRNPQFDVIARDDVIERSQTKLICKRDLKLARLYGAGLSQLGLRNDISTGPYPPCGAWSDALWLHPMEPDGLLYHSRHDPLQICIALFERPDITWQIEQTVVLTHPDADIATRLQNYGKSIYPPL
jgi:hypothetical protein